MSYRLKAIHRVKFGGMFRLLFSAFFLAVVAVSSSIPTVAVAANSSNSTSGDVLKVRLGGDKQQTRLVIELGKSATGQILNDNPSGETLTIGLSGLRLGQTISGNGQGLIKSWRLENIGGSVRLRLSFNGKGQVYRRFLLPPADGISAYRYVVDIIPSGSDPDINSQSEPTPVYTSPVTSSTSYASQTKRTKKVIVIDAGHGGHDPGASGKATKEKDVTLASALALKSALEKTGRYTVIMTRETDTYVDLTARVRIARNADADLFISLHADSGSENSTVRGASIYTLSDSGSERAAKKAMVKGDWSLAEAPQDKIVNRILIDLSQRATKNRSSIFAQLVMDNIADSTPLMKTSQRQAGFMVLLAPDVPAVLLEMGFLTNQEDESMLNDSKHRATMMGQVAKGIDQYFSNEVRYASFAGIE